MKNIQALLLLSTLAALPTQASQLAEKQSSKASAAHVHGSAKLNIAIEANQLLINFESPAINIFGFEHAAHSEEEINAAKHAKQQLMADQDLFQLNHNSCHADNIDIDFSAISKTTHNDEHEHEHEHEHEKHAHSDIRAQYHFTCEQNITSETLSVALLKYFPNITQLHVFWVTEKQQGTVVLTPSSYLATLP